MGGGICTTPPEGALSRCKQGGSSGHSSHLCGTHAHVSSRAEAACASCCCWGWLQRSSLQRSSRSTSCCDVHHGGGPGRQLQLPKGACCRGLSLSCRVPSSGSRTAGLPTVAPPYCRALLALPPYWYMQLRSCEGFVGGCPRQMPRQGVTWGLAVAQCWCVVVTPCGRHPSDMYCLYCCLPCLAQPGSAGTASSQACCFPLRPLSGWGKETPCPDRHLLALVLHAYYRKRRLLGWYVCRLVRCAAGCCCAFVLRLHVIGRWWLLRLHAPKHWQGFVGVADCPGSSGAWDQAPCAQAHSPGVCWRPIHHKAVVWGVGDQAVLGTVPASGAVQACVSSI